MHKSWLITTIFAGITLALAATTAAPARADDWNKKYTFTGKPDLRVETDDGDIEVTPGPANEVSVHVSTSGYKISPSDVHISESQDADHLQILVKGPHHMFTFNFGGRHAIRVQLIVPALSDMNLHSGDGSIHANQIAGKIEIDTGDGNVDSNGLHGTVKIHTGDGHVEGTDFDGNLNADTGDGHITVTGRFDVLYLKSGDGSIEATVQPGSKIASSWMVHTGDGRINLKLPDGFSADLDAHTGDGHINLDFPVMVSGSLSESRIHGKMNGGGGSLTLTSGDGSIHVEKI
jgi:DUF4097 and DUF4098 domain-containing protein YvlB